MIKLDGLQFYTSFENVKHPVQYSPGQYSIIDSLATEEKSHIIEFY
jgi:hypothetical protein